MRTALLAALISTGALLSLPVAAQDSLTATIKSVTDKGKIQLNDGSFIVFDPTKVKVEGTPVAGAKVAIVFSGDENGYEISRVVITE